MLKRHNSFYDACNDRTTLGVTNIGFDRSDKNTVLAENVAHCGRLERIS